LPTDFVSNEYRFEAALNSLCLYPAPNKYSVQAIKQHARCRFIDRQTHSWCKWNQLHKYVLAVQLGRRPIDDRARNMPNVLHYHAPIGRECSLSGDATAPVSSMFAGVFAL
jgi:hypothetical protein